MVETRSTTGLSLALAIVAVVLVGSTALVMSSSSSSSSSSSEAKSGRDQQQQQEEEYCQNTNPHFHPNADVTDDDSGSNNNNKQQQSQSSSLLLYHFESIASTQDEARRIAEETELPNSIGSDNGSDNTEIVRTFCVTATEQTNGRGTSGRQWMGSRGNTFVTIGIPQQSWLAWQDVVPLTLLPLKIGSLVAHRIQELLDEKYCVAPPTDNTNHNDDQCYVPEPMVTVKWPNDVLVDDKKIAGILIESSRNGWFLIGIGINVAYGPPVPNDGPNRGRPSTSLQQACKPITLQYDADDGNDKNNEKDLWASEFDFVEDAKQLGIHLALDLHRFMHVNAPPSKGEDIVKEWTQWVDWDMELTMRDTPQRERVKMTNVLPDGRVQVVNQEDGLTRTLVTDYFL